MLDGEYPLDTKLGAGVVLRRLSAADAPAFAAHAELDHEHLGRFLGWPEICRSPEGAAGWLGNYEHQVDGRVVAGGAWRDDGRLLGGALLLRHDPVLRNVELGVWAAAETAGSGLAAACCRILLAVARDDLQAARVIWECDTENVASRRLGERLGFTYEGTLRSCYEVRGERRDLDVLSLVGAEIDAALT